MESSQFKSFWESQKTPLHAHKQNQWYDAYAEEIKGYLPTNGIIVDAGCGSGEIISRLSPYYDRIIGIDYSDSMLSEARQKRYERSVDFFCGSIVNIKDFCPPQVDAIYSNGVVQYLSHDEFRSFIENGLSILPPNGHLVILQIPNINCRTLFRLGFYRHEKSVPFRSFLNGLISLKFADLVRRIKERKTKLDDGIGNWYSIGEVKDMIRSMGASVNVYGSKFVNYSYRFHAVISKN